MNGLRMLPVKKLKAHPKNHIFEQVQPGFIEILARSIDVNGMEAPIVVRSDGTILSGHKRVAACQLLQWDTVPVVVREDMRPEEELSFVIRQNTERNPIRRDHRIRIYQEIAPQFFTDKTVRRDFVNELALKLSISPHTILKDLETIRHPKKNSITPDDLKRAWNTKGKSDIRITIAESEAGFIVIAAGKRCRYESGPGKYEVVLYDSYRKAKSEYFQNSELQPENVNAGARIKSIRKRLRFTQTKMGGELGVSQSYYAELEAGKYNPERYLERCEELANHVG